MKLSVHPILNVRSLPNKPEASSPRRAQALSKVNAVEETDRPNVANTATGNSASLQVTPVNSHSIFLSQWVSSRALVNPPAPRSFRDRAADIIGISSIYEAVFTAIYGTDPLHLNDIA